MRPSADIPAERDARGYPAPQANSADGADERMKCEERAPDGPGLGNTRTVRLLTWREGTEDATSSGFTGEPARGFTQFGREPRRIDAVGRHHGADQRIGQRLVQRHVAAAGADPRVVLERHHASLA